MRLKKAKFKIGDTVTCVVGKYSSHNNGSKTEVEVIRGSGWRKELTFTIEKITDASFQPNNKVYWGNTLNRYGVYEPYLRVSFKGELSNIGLQETIDKEVNKLINETNDKR